MSNPTVLLETTSGDILIELFPDKAPDTVANFLQYVDDGFYANTIFHRVIPGFMIQGGGLFQGHLALQQGQPLAQLLLALFFRAFFQFFLIGGQAVPQDGLDLAQMLVGLLCGLGLAEDALHVHADHVRAGVQAAGQGQGQHEGKTG